MQILIPVREALQTRKVNLLSLDRVDGGFFDITLPIDSQLEEFTVQVSGDRPSVAIFDASGLDVNKLTYGRRFKHLLNLPKAYTAYIKEPAPGMWRMKISAESAHTIRITGESVHTVRITGESAHTIRNTGESVHTVRNTGESAHTIRITGESARTPSASQVSQRTPSASQVSQRTVSA